MWYTHPYIFPSRSCPLRTIFCCLDSWRLKNAPFTQLHLNLKRCYLCDSVYSIAFDKSRKAPKISIDGFAPQKMKIYAMTISWCILESLGQNPVYLLFNKQLLSKNWQILSNSNFANTFVQIDKKGCLSIIAI